MSRKWEYNGVTLEVDLQDADFAEKYEAAFANMGENEKKLQKTGSNSEMIRGYCGLFYQLFDDLYGAGTGDKLFDGKCNAGKCDEAYAQFITAAKADSEEARKRRSEFVSRYIPQQNREQRRQQNKSRHQNGKNRPHTPYAS